MCTRPPEPSYEESYAFDLFINFYHGDPYSYRVHHTPEQLKCVLCQDYSIKVMSCCGKISVTLLY